MAFPGRHPLSSPAALDGSHFVFSFLAEEMTTAAWVLCQDQQKHIPEPRSLRLRLLFLPPRSGTWPLFTDASQAWWRPPDPTVRLLQRAVGRGTVPRVQGPLRTVPPASPTPGSWCNLEFL